MELRRGGMGSQTVGRRMDGDCRDGGGGGSKDAGSEDYENLPTSASLSTHMTAGAMAGIMEHMVMYPVDSVKVRRQETGGSSEHRGESARACGVPGGGDRGSSARSPRLPTPPGGVRVLAHRGSRRRAGCPRRSERRAPPARGAPGCPHVRRFRGSWPPGSAHRARA